MGLLDWLTDGIGSSMEGSSMPQTMPEPPMPPVQQVGADRPPPMPTAQPPLSFQRPEFVTPPGFKAAAGPPPDPTTSDIGAGMQGGGLPPSPVPMPAPRPAAANAPPPIPMPAPRPAAAPPRELPPPLAAGPSELPPGAAPTNGVMPPGAPTSLAPPPGATPALPGGGSFIGRSLGLDANQEKSMFGSLGAGLTAAGNSKGKSKGQALFSGAGGALEGGQKAEDTAYNQRLKALGLAVTAQAKGDTAEYNRNYAEYLKGKLASDAAKATPNARSGAWNKPDSQKYVDAGNLVARDPDIGTQQDIVKAAVTSGDTQRAAAEQQKLAQMVEKKKAEAYSVMNLSPQTVAAMNGNPPGTPKNPHQVMTKQDFDIYVKPGQAYINPKDNQVYIRKGAGGATPEAASPTPDTPIAPPGPMPRTQSGTDAETAYEPEESN